MTLKGSEIKNFLSWRVSTILKSFLVTSASSHFTLPHFIKPTLRVHKIVPKITFLISRIRSQYLLLEVIVHAEEECLAFWPLGVLDRISIHVLSRIGTVPCRRASCGRSSRFCFSLSSACVSKYFRLQRKYFRLRFRSLLPRCRRTLCRSSLWPTCSIHEKFWPTSENCLCLQIQF